MANGTIQKNICMVGVVGTGKTSLASRFVSAKFSDKDHKTIGVKIDRKAVVVGDREARLLLWDLAGRDDFGSLDHVLASAICGEIDPFIGLVDPADDDTLPRSTTRHTKRVSDDAIAATLVEHVPSGVACRELIEAALVDGGSDNVTAIVARRASGTA